MAAEITQIVQKYNQDAGRLMDILIDVQTSDGFISADAVGQIADGLNISRVDVEQTISFYHFFSTKPTGKYAVYVNNSAVAEMKGQKDVLKAFEQAAGVCAGCVSEDGQIGLYETADIGMNDQEPAALINGIPFTSLTADRAKVLVADMKAGKAVADMVNGRGEGNNANELVKSEVKNNIRQKGAVLFGDYEKGAAVQKAAGMTPEAVIEEVKNSNLRGRGGAGFPTGMKWDFTRKAQGDQKYIICNADEGEPGTFKDRVLLTEVPHLLIEGMAVGGYAIGATEGVIYLRGEYMYLKKFLEAQLEEYRQKNWLGQNIAGKDGFNFDIRIQMGHGAYVCGEESALIESAEGKRGEPRNRPPFPAQQGYKNKPTSVNNVESLSAAAQILVKGADWFKGFGTEQSAGTKVLSVSGDCEKSGIYEVEWGITVQSLLDLVGAKDVQAVQVGGPSGTCIGANDFGKTISFEGLATGGSIIVIGKDRNLLDIVQNFMEFFMDESCGSCVPCRAGTRIIASKIQKINQGKGKKSDLDVIRELGRAMKTLNKCGLGQTAFNPAVTTIQNLPEAYNAVIAEDSDYDPAFDMAAEVTDSCEFVGRTPNL